MEKQYYITKEQFTALTAAWKAKASHSAAEHIIYNILRSKDAKLGFCEKTKSIQGNDPWYGFKTALSEAKSLCGTKNLWEQYRGNERYARSVEGADARIKANQAVFLNTFGMEMPADFFEQLGA